MDRDAIRELFDYTGWAWERLAGTIASQPAIYAENVPGSGWPSIAACLTHVVSAYDGWLNGPFGGPKLGEMSYPVEWPKPVTSWTDMAAYRGRTRESFLGALATSDDELFAARFREQGSPGDPLSLADILTNLVLHERGHHGDLNTLFHQLGITSYLIDFTFFRTRRDDFVLDDGTN